MVAQDRLARGFQRGQVSGPHRDHGVNGLHLRQHRGENSHQRHVDDDDPVLGLVSDELDLLREQPDVERVQHRTHRRHGDVGLQVLLVVPHEGGDPLIAVDAETPQGVGQAGSLLADLPVGGMPEPVPGGGGDRAVAVDIHRVAQDLRDGQRGVLHGAQHRAHLR